MKRILLVDKDRGAAERLAALLRMSDPKLCLATAVTPHGAALIAAGLDVKLVLIGLTDDRCFGLESARQIASSCDGQVQVLVSVVADAQMRQTLEGHLFDGALGRPVRVAGLLDLIDRVCAGTGEGGDGRVRPPATAPGR